jgi:hypothetical protein
MRVLYSEHLKRTMLVDGTGITHLVGGAAEAFNAIGVEGNSRQNTVGRDHLRLIIEGLGFNYDTVRDLPTGKRLLRDGRIVDAGRPKWPAGNWR